ncbi:MAG: hypothetical protein WBC33_00655, partial [Conexibacter sp.]
AVIAPGAGAVGAARLASALDVAIAAADMPAGIGHVAVTVAWATVPDDATTAERLIHVADCRLMERKRERKHALDRQVHELRG